MNFIKEKIKGKEEIIIMFFYIIITFLIAIFFHEKWRDEAQAWLLARDLNPIELFRQMRYEGHPFLWSLILMPFAKLGFPYITQSIISLLIMWAAVWIFLKKSSFNNFIKITILLSLPIIYLYPVISRNYSLIPLSLSIIAMLYKQRNEKKLQYIFSILLLAYTHILMWGLVGILYVIYFIEQIKQIIKNKENKKENIKVIVGFGIAIIGLIVLIISLMGSTTANQGVKISLEFNKYIFNIFFKKVLYNLIGYFINSNIVIEVLYFILIIMFIYEAITYRKNSLIMFVAIFWELVVFLFIYRDWDAQKTNTMFLILIFISWINLEQEKTKIVENTNKILKFVLIYTCTLILLFCDVNGLQNIMQEVNYIYSDSKYIAKFINDNIEEEAIFICMDMPRSSAIIPYVDNRKFISSVAMKEFTYVTWNENAYKRVSTETAIQNAYKIYKENQKLYLIESIYKDNENNDIKKLQEQNILSNALYETDFNNIYKDEAYKIYKINF